MTARTPLLLAALGLWACQDACAWTSPGSGQIYDPEALVAASNGALTGSWPNYSQSQALIISTGDELRLPAGTHWTTSGSVELRVRGLLRAPGTPWEPILLEAASGQPNSWTGLILDSAAPASHLRCVTVRGGDDGLNCLGSSPLVEYCTFSGNYSSGLSCFLSAHPVLRHCLVENNSRYGVEITGGCSPVLEHCVIRGNNLEGTSPRNAVSIGIQGSNSPRFTSCLLEGRGPANPASGFSLWMAGNPQLRDCEIRDFRSGVVIQGAGAAGSLERCWIHSNRYTNPIQGGSGINVNTSATPLFRSCCLEDNDWGVTLTSTCAPDFGGSATPGGNRLHGNGNGGAVWDFYNNTSGGVQARGNWWGTTDSAAIELHIHDDGDGAYGAVQTDPILTDSLFAPLLSPGLGYAALLEGAQLALRPADHFRHLPGSAYSLEGPGQVVQDGDSLRWTPPAGGDSLFTLLLRAVPPQGDSSCDTLVVWLRRAGLAAPTLGVEISGSGMLLSWSAVAGATAYRLERSAGPDFPQGTTETLFEGMETSFLDPQALEQVAAFYRVRALDTSR